MVGKVKIDRAKVLSPRGYIAKLLGLLPAKIYSAVVIVLAYAFIATATASALTLISQGFLTNDKPATGAIVSLQKDSTDYVDTTTIDNANNILGVVINSDNSQLSLSSGKANQVQVATNGLTQVLVSNINGNISTGDSITASPITGVGMKATSNAKAVGIAQDNFPNSTASDQTYQDKTKQSHTVKIGQIPILVNVTYFYKQPDKTIIPSALQNIADSFAGKTVKPLPILISIGIFFVTLIVVVSIVYAMIHSSIISVGRNPMSQSAVYRNVLQLSALVVVILGVAVVSIYMVLARL